MLSLTVPQRAHVVPLPGAPAVFELSKENPDYLVYSAFREKGFKEFLRARGVKAENGNTSSMFVYANDYARNSPDDFRDLRQFLNILTEDNVFPENSPLSTWVEQTSQHK